MKQTTHLSKLALVLAAALFVVGVPAEPSADSTEVFPTPAIDTALFAVG